MKMYSSRNVQKLDMTKEINVMSNLNSPLSYKLQKNNHSVNNS